MPCIKKIKNMFNISIAKIDTYTEEQYNFIFGIYTRHNAKEDLEEGRLTFKRFISIEETNSRIKKGSVLFQVTINATQVSGIFEIEDNHLTLICK